MCDVQTILKSFISDKFISSVPYGEGHINDTYAVTFESNSGDRYRMLLQRINHTVFTDPLGLMNNIDGVTKFLKKKIIAAGGDENRETLTVIPTKTGELFYHHSDGTYWRVYIFIEDAITYQSSRNQQDFYNCGVCFGNFQLMLSDFDTNALIETIADFHNTVKRFEALKLAISQDQAGRLKDVQPEVDFALEREKYAGAIIEMLETGKIPYRVTHNDTKLNNMMIDNATGVGICVIDLDTVMPGAACYDFGDSIRFGASTAAEDETDLDKVSMDLELFEVFAKGYLSVSKGFLTPAEVESLAIGAKIMTFECGIRFLTDYLNGDNYFKIHREHHNLDRCRTQFKLVADMEQKMSQMQEIVRKNSL
ncbi:MAG: phosphotransferase [Oscillospiraceae bacterium]|nr:phosphotransferase [Oscillospiraceae bacterium]